MNKGQKIKLKLVKSDLGNSLGQYLSAHESWFRGFDVESALQESRFSVNGQPISLDYCFSEGDDFQVFKAPWCEPSVPDIIETLYEDDQLWAVNKPPGLPITPSGDFYDHSLLHLLRARSGLEHLSPIHRLDLETSGTLLLAKTVAARSFFQPCFQRGDVEKCYLALVFGHFPEHLDRIDFPLIRDTRIHTKWVEGKDGKSALTLITDVKHIWKGEEAYSLLLLKPITGRTNQIRAHLAGMGHSIVGDKKYYPDPEIFFHWLEHKQMDGLRALLKLDHHALHCQTLTIPMPDGSRKTITTELPPFAT